jgi:hypothetical protein
VLEQARSIWQRGIAPEALAFLRLFFEQYADGAARQPTTVRFWTASSDSG